MKQRFALLLLAATLACGRGRERTLSANGFLGVEIPTPVSTPALGFIDSHGKPYDLRAMSADKVTLLMVGYTHCPDVCPVHLANLAAVLDKMPEEVQSKVQVVFVTTDPRRDSPAVLDSFMRHFDASFVALTGSDSAITAVQQALQLGVAYEDSTRKDGSYTVGHASAVVAVTRDGMARVKYPFGTRQEDWAHDLPLLVGYLNR